MALHLRVFETLLIILVRMVFRAGLKLGGPSVLDTRFLWKKVANFRAKKVAAGCRITLASDIKLIIARHDPTFGKHRLHRPCPKTAGALPSSSASAVRYVMYIEHLKSMSRMQRQGPFKFLLYVIIRLLAPAFAGRSYFQSSSDARLLGAIQPADDPHEQLNEIVVIVG